MAFPARKAGAGGRGWMVAALALLAWAVAAPATVTFIVNTNRDLDDQTPNQPMSLRKAIRLANQTDLSLGDVLITFDPTVFQSLNGANWVHVNGGLYYDEPDLAAPANDPNRIVVGTPELSTEPGFEIDSFGSALPLPCVTRDNVKLKAELNNDGIPDVRIDLGELLPTNFFNAGFFIIPARSFGFQIGTDIFSALRGNPINSASGQISNVVLEGFDIRFAPSFSPADQSPPAVWITNGTNHRIVNSDLQARGIGVQTDLAAGNQVFIGGISSGSSNSISGFSYAGVYCTGAGTTTIQQNNITGCGTGTDAGNDISGGVVLVGTGTNVVGGTVSGSRNTIASNTTEGVVVAGSGPNFIQNNAITGNSRSGIWIFGSGNNIIGGSATLSGNTISGNGTQAGGFFHAGVFITGGGNNTIQGNVIGSGNGNGGAGIYITGDGNNRIGGTATAARNIVGRNGALLSSESSTGIDVRGDGANIIENNHVGTDAAGQASDANVGHGISIGAEAGGDNTIGGTQVASRNVISGNGLNGLRLGGTGDNVVTGNYLGMAADGQTALGNNVNGIEIAASAGGNPVGINGNRIGGDSAAERNVIAANGTDGITVNGTGNNLFYGNYLGLAADGATRQGNGRHGISITVQALGNNIIGNRAPGRRNVISGNGQFGVSIESTPALNKVQSNYIGINAAATDGVFNGAGGVSVSSPVGQLIGGSELGDGNIVSGNRENANADGIELLGAGDHVVAGNVIGAVPVNPAGFPQDARLVISDVFRNGGSGVLIGGGSTGALSVGFDPTDGSPDSNLYEGNVIVNNNGEGIQVAGSGNVTIVNNLIGVGLNAAGTFAGMGNTRDGILLSGAGNNTLGLDEELPDKPNTNWFNVVSGNGGNGVSITGPGNNVLTHNRVGTDPVAGFAVANTANGVSITGTGDNALSHNTISGNGQNGVFQFSTGTATLLGNSIGVAGLDRVGTAAVANGGHGVFVPNNAPGQLVLGVGKTVDPIGFNVMSGNAGDGVHIEGNVANVVQGNLIGTNGQLDPLDTTSPRGTARVANGGSGLYLQGPKTASNEVVDNTISGNTLYGVDIVSGGNLLRRNKIGTNDVGDAALGNGSHGIFISDPNLPTERAGQLIGRLAAGNVRESNIISGNGGDGIHIAQAGGNAINDVTDDVVIFTNFIGLDASGLNPIGNAGDGIEVESGCTGRVVIGGTTNGQGNVVAGNTGWGVRFESEYSYNRPVTIDNTPLIYGNFIGTDQQGAQVDPQLRNGGGILVNVDGGNIPNDPRVVPIGAPTGRPQIGGVFLSTNLIAGNAGDGIRVDGNVGVASAGANIVGCFIGTDSFGRKVIGNTGNGIAVTANHSGSVTIGGAGQINRNLIAGSGLHGLDINGTGVIDVVNNYVGARESATGPLTFDNSTGGNAAGGILLQGGTGTDTATLSDNVVFRGGTDGGIRVAYSRPATLDADTVSLSLSSAGVSLDGTGVYTLTNSTITDNGVLPGSVPGVLLGANTTTNGATIGGGAALPFGTGFNTIQRNTGPGIAVVRGAGNRLSGNLINANNGLAVDLGNDGVTLNDGTTTAGSPNQLFDFPVLLPLELSGTTYTIAGTLPANTAAVEIYQALDAGEATPDPLASAHHGEVDHRLARLAAGSPGFNAALGTFTVNVDSGAGDGFVDDAGGRLVLVTAIALNAAGDTSEFARNIGVISLGRSTVSVAPAAISADGTQTATAFATIRDAIDTPLEGVDNVLITATPQGGGVLPPTIILDQDLNNDTVVDSTTDAAGQVTAQLTATDRAGSPVTIGATVNGVALPPPLPTLTLLVGQPSATRNSIVQVPPATPVTADGVSQGVLQITLLDGSGAVGAPVQGVPANQIQVIQVDGSGNPLATPTTGLTITQPTAATDANGQTTASVVTTSADSDPSTPVRDPYRFSFTVNAVRAIGGSSIVVVDFLAGAPSASQSTFGANPTNNVPADGTTTSTLTLTVLDAQGNPLVGVPATDIVVTANPTTGLTITNVDPSPAPLTDDAGQMQWTVTSTKPGTVTFVATVRGTTVTQTPTVTFVVGSASGNSSLVANPLQARPNGTDVIDLTATVLDGQGNPVPNVVVTITPVQGQGVSMIGPDQPTDANGVTRATATATVQGQVIFAATVLVGNVATEIGRATVDFRNLQPSNSLSSLSVQTDDPLLANGQRTVTGTLRLVDTLSDPLRSVAPGNITVAVLDAGSGLPFAGTTVSGPNDATDSNGQTSFIIVSSQPGTVRIVVTVTGAPDVVLDDQPEVEFLPFITQTYGPGLHLMGLMGTPRQPDPRFVLAALQPNLKLARWDEGQQQYIRWTEFSPTAPFAMNPGRGFWLQLDSLVSFTAVADATPLTPFTLTLANGWNEVANPYPGTFTFRLADITVLQNGTPVGTLATAAAQALVMPYGWRWDPVQQYLLLVDPSVGSGVASAQVSAGRGWWWLCRANGITVRLTPPPPGARAVQPAPTPGQWSASLTAATPEGKGEVMLGAGKTRLRAEAPPDALAPPAVRVQFVDAQGRAASDLREAAPGQPQTWTLEVQPSRPGPVTLSWDSLGRSLPRGHRLWLADPSTGRRVVMNTRSSYAWQGEGRARTLTIELDPHGTQKLHIADMSVGAGRARGSVLPVTVTLTSPAELSLTVRGLGGRLVRQVRQSGAGGANVVAWDGRDQSGRPVPAGTYIIELTAQSDEGEVARAVRNVTVR